MPRFQVVIAVAALAALASLASAQGTFEPFPGNSAARYQSTRPSCSWTPSSVIWRVAAGRVLGPEQIEQLTQQIGVRYSLWFGPRSERRLMWIQPTQFYTWPLYRVNYAIARLLALTYMDRLRRDPVSFARAYNAMLRNGYDDDPEVLLQRMLTIDLRNVQVLAANARRIIEEWQNER